MAWNSLCRPVLSSLPVSCKHWDYRQAPASRPDLSSLCVRARVRACVHSGECVYLCVQVSTHMGRLPQLLSTLYFGSESVTVELTHAARLINKLHPQPPMLALRAYTGQFLHSFSGCKCRSSCLYRYCFTIKPSPQPLQPIFKKDVLLTSSRTQKCQTSSINTQKNQMMMLLPLRSRP